MNEPADAPMTIGTFARRSRLSLKALRLYDRLGLLRPDRVDTENGYRRYRESQLATARLIGQLRRLDMPLAVVAKVVSSPSAAGAELIAIWWQSVERRTAFQRELALHLRIRLSGLERSYDMFQVKQRDVAEQTVLSEQKHVKVPELPDWIGAAGSRLIEVAHGLGGQVGPMFVIYHGEVNEDSDGPVEVCLPIGTGGAVPAQAAVRREPAHHEAFVTLRKAQVEYPQILSAYDAVSEWAAANGKSGAGSPREVYFSDFMAASPDDEVCDVALPIR
jgi:DNA-binding transcriptional MerR regulator